MRSRFLATTAVVLISTGFVSFGKAETVYRTYTTPQPVISTWRTVSPSVQVVPTPVIVERPVVVSESALPRLSPPMGETVLHYDRPGMTTISTGSATRITALPAPVSTETVVSERVVVLPRTETQKTSQPELRPLTAPEPLLSTENNLKPLLPRRLPAPEAKQDTTTKEPDAQAMKSHTVPELPGPPPKDEEELPIRELVVTEREKSGETENIFKDIMAPRNIVDRDMAIPTTVAKPPRPLPTKEPPTKESVETPITVRPIKIDPLPVSEAEPTERAERKPPAPPSRQLTLGQVNSRSLVDEIMSEPPPYPEGPADPGEIDHKLIDAATIVPSPIDVSGISFPDKPEKGKLGLTDNRAKSSDQWVSGALLLTTIIALMVASYAVVLAFEFRQRWLQSVTEQNNRFALGYDNDLLPDVGYYEDLPGYGGGSLYGDSSSRINRFSSDMLEPSIRY